MSSYFCFVYMFVFIYVVLYYLLRLSSFLIFRITVSAIYLPCDSCLISACLNCIILLI